MGISGLLRKPCDQQSLILNNLVYLILNQMPFLGDKIRQAPSADRVKENYTFIKRIYNVNSICTIALAYCEDVQVPRT